jgi:hypothetical protein
MDPICRECGEGLTADNWRRKKFGSKICDRCFNASVRDWNETNPERSLVNTARRRAKAKGIEFSITPADISVPTHCPVLGIELRRGSGGFNPTSPTIDRIDSSRGYVRGNVVVVSWRANKIKGDATKDELAALARFYAS